jgi:hypothetical protein
MIAHLKLNGTELAVTFGPEMPVESVGEGPGGWKAIKAQPAAMTEQLSDPQDPDPMGLGPLDVFEDDAFSREEVQP